MEQLISVRSLFKDTDAYAGKEIKVGGWVRNLRASKNFGFINPMRRFMCNPVRESVFQTLQEKMRRKKTFQRSLIIFTIRRSIPM